MLDGVQQQHIVSDRAIRGTRFQEIDEFACSQEILLGNDPSKRRRRENTETTIGMEVLRTVVTDVEIDQIFIRVYIE